MHDMMYQPLKVGDTVLIPAKITQFYATEDYCNVSVETTQGRRPDGSKETIGAINTATMLKVADGSSPSA